MTKEVIALSFAKAPVSIASRRLDWPSLQPICTLVSFLQLKKARLPIDCTLSGSTASVMPVARKVSTPIFSMLSGRTSLPVSFTAPLNAPAPSDSRFAKEVSSTSNGTCTLASAEAPITRRLESSRPSSSVMPVYLREIYARQFAKALSPRRVTLPRPVTPVRRKQWSKASCGISVTLSRPVTRDRYRQFLKAARPRFVTLSSASSPANGT